MAANASFASPSIEAPSLTVQIVTTAAQDTVVCNVFAENGTKTLDSVDLSTSGTSPSLAGNFGVFSTGGVCSAVGATAFGALSVPVGIGLALSLSIAL